STMRAEVDVLEPEEFVRWLESESKGRVLSRDTAVEPGPGQDTPNQIVADGRRQAAKQGCLKCHSIDGSPHIGPTWLDLYPRKEKLEDGSTVLVDEGYITESM